MSKRRPRRSRAKDPNGLPKGAHRLPNGNYVMSSAPAPINERGRRLSITAVRKAEPDPAQVAKALVAIAIELANQQHNQSD
jgi:hypothetical protein